MENRHGKSLVVGLTGGIASGKDVIARLFAAMDVPIVDADEISRRLTAAGTPGARAMIDLFGSTFALPDGRPNRSALREHVFRHPADRKRLEALLHPLVYAEMVRLLATTPPAAYTLLVSPVLLETRQRKLCNKIIAVTAQPDVQMRRAMQRDALSRAQVQRIMAAQLPEPARIAQADFVLANNGSRRALKKDVGTLHRRLLDAIRLAQAHA